MYSYCVSIKLCHSIGGVDSKIDFTIGLPVLTNLGWLSPFSEIEFNHLVCRVEANKANSMEDFHKDKKPL